jgi:hypothetical protein
VVPRNASMATFFLNRTFLIFLIVIFSAPSFGASPTTLVKVYSVHEGSSRPARLGSGMLLKEKGRVFVLTSDHVIYRGAAPYRHRVWNETWGYLEAEYRFADWGRGIALLEISGEVAKPVLASPDVPEFSQLKGEENLQRSQVHVMGYPAESKVVLDHTLGQATGPLFFFGMFSSLRHIAFIEKSLGEYGMSGGPVFYGDSDRGFLGVLSHLMFFVGSRTEEIGKVLDPSAMVLVVPFSELQEPLRKYFDTGSLAWWEFYQPEVELQPAQQIVRSSHLEFDVRLAPDARDILWVNEIRATFLDSAATPGRHGQEAQDYYGMIETAFASLPPSVPRTGRFTGVRFEDGFHYSEFNRVDLANFPAFVTGTRWSNIRALFLYREPDRQELIQKLGGFVKKIDRILSSDKNDYEAQRWAELKSAFENSIKNSRFSDWTVAAPRGFSSLFYQHPLSAEGKRLSEEITAYVGQFVI